MAFVYAEQATWSGKRFLALLGAIAVNLGFILALSNGLSFEFVKKLPPRTVVEFEPPEEQPVLDAPVFPGVAEPAPFKLYVPVPDEPIVIESPQEGIPAQSESRQPTQVSLPPTALQAVGVLTPPVYPATSIKFEEQGTVQLMIYVLPDGRVGDVRVARSSGYPRLDQAAIAAARRGWQFKPATSGAGPVAAWGRYAVTFSLKD